MNLLKISFNTQFWWVPLFAVALLPSCSKVLSHRTDEQAWIDFDKEARLSRVPAAFNDNSSPGLAALHENLSNIPVRAILLKCGTSSNVPACYQSVLTLDFDETFRAAQLQFTELKLGDYKREQKIFFGLRSYDTLLDEVNRFHQSILSGLDLKARAHALELFKLCENDAKKDAIIEDFSVFSSILSEIPKGTYACLVDHWLIDQNALLNETTDRLGLKIVTDDAKTWIKAQQVAPIYELEINSEVAKKSHAESERFKLEKNEVLAGFDRTQPQEKLLKEWSEKLRERYPYSPVEQWIIGYAKEQP